MQNLYSLTFVQQGSDPGIILGVGDGAGTSQAVVLPLRGLHSSCEMSENTQVNELIKDDDKLYD